MIRLLLLLLSFSIASKERNPMKEIGDPKKIAKTIDFLLDAHKNWMTGQVIHVDGGMNNLK